MKKRKLLSLGLAILMATISLTGCKTAEEKEAEQIEAQKQKSALMEVNQNDYRGGYMRVGAIRSKVVQIVEDFNQVQTGSILQSSPSNYWDNDNFIYFKNNFLVTQFFDDTQYLNEVETDWETAYNATYGCFFDANGVCLKDTYLDPFSIIKNPDQPNSYKFVYGATTNPFFIESDFSINMNYDVICTFDPNHDWLQMKKLGTFDGSMIDRDLTGDDKITVCDELVEYGRQKSTNSFIIQNSRERLYVTYETLEGTVENEFNPLENAKITSFYYSRLSDVERPEYTQMRMDYAQSLLEQDEEAPLEDVFGKKAESKYITKPYKLVPDVADLTVYYNLTDTIFTHIDDITPDWVVEYPVEEGYYDLYVTFDGYDLTIQNKNKLSDQIECITFKSDGTIQDSTNLILHPLHQVEIPYVNSDGTIHGTVTINVNDNGDMTDAEGNVLMSGDTISRNSDNEIILVDEIMEKLGLETTVSVEGEGENTGESEATPTPDNEESTE